LSPTSIRQRTERGRSVFGIAVDPAIADARRRDYRTLFSDYAEDRIMR
jgi:hypothetical protein